MLLQGNKFDWSRNDCDRGFLYDMYRECEEQKWIKKHIKSREKHRENEEDGGKIQRDSKEVRSLSVSQRPSATTIEHQKSRCHKSKKRKPRSEVEERELPERQHRSEVKVHVSKKRQQRSEEKVNKMADQKRAKQNDIVSEHEKQLKEIENDLIEEANLENAASRHQNKKKLGNTGKKRDKSGSENETKKSKTDHRNDEMQGKGHLTEKSNAIKEGKESFINRNTTVENQTNAHHNTSVLEGHKHSNGSNTKFKQSQNTTHHAANHAYKETNTLKTRYDDLDLNNNSTSRHEKIMNILTWLDELLKSEKEMYAHEEKGKKKHKCAKKSKTTGKSHTKAQSRSGRMKKRTSKKPFVYEDDIDELEKKGNDVMKTGRDIIGSGSSIKERGKNQVNNNIKKENDIEKKETDVKEGQSDNKEGGSSAKKREKHVKNKENNNSKRGNDIEKIGSYVKEGQSDNKERENRVKKREKYFKSHGINNKKKGNDAKNMDIIGRENDVLHAGSDVKRRKRVSKKEIEKRLISHCKLTAHLFYLAVRGFGQRFYRKNAAQWCHHDCVEDHGLPHIKKYNRPRKMM